MGRRKDRREILREKIEGARRRNDERKEAEEVRLCKPEAVDEYIKTAYARRDLPILFIAPPSATPDEATEKAARITARFGFETFRRMDGDEARVVWTASGPVDGMPKFVDDILAGHRGLVGIFNARDVESLILRLESQRFGINRACIINIRVIVVLDDEYSITQVIESVALNRETGEIVLSWPFLRSDLWKEDSGPWDQTYKSSKSVVFGINLGDDDRFRVDVSPGSSGSGEASGRGEASG